VFRTAEHAHPLSYPFAPLTPLLLLKRFRMPVESFWRAANIRTPICHLKNTPGVHAFYLRSLSITGIKIKGNYA